MDKDKLIKAIINEVAYMTKKGYPDWKEGESLYALATVLKKFGLTEIRDELMYNLIYGRIDEAEDGYTHKGGGYYVKAGKEDDENAQIYKKDGDSYIEVDDEEVEKKEEPKANPIFDKGYEDAYGSTVDDKGAKPDELKDKYTKLGEKVPEYRGKEQYKQIYQTLTDTLESGNPEEIQNIVDKYGVEFAVDKNTFYITRDDNKQQITGDARKLFGDAKKSKKLAQQQKDLIDALDKAGVKIKKAYVSTNPLQPTELIPKEMHQKIEGNVDVDGSVTFNDVKYDFIEDVTQFTENNYNKWLETDEGKAATDEQKEKTKIKFKVIGESINSRNNIVRNLVENNIPSAVIDSPESIEKLEEAVQSKMLEIASDATKETITNTFNDIKAAETPDAAKDLMIELIKTVEKDSNFKEQRGMIPGLVENFSALYEAKKGRRVVVPMVDNFPASDVISLDTEDLEDTPENLLKQINVIYSGVSVKFGKGGSSSQKEKAKQSFFVDDEKTKQTLDLLSSQVSDTGNVFDEDETVANARIEEVKGVLNENLDLVKKYFGFGDDVTSADDLIEYLGNGRVKCEDGEVVPVEKPRAPLDRKGINHDGWRLMFTMQNAWSAIYNTKVVSQGFSSQNWTSKGLVEIDGLNKLAQQQPQGYKQLRGKGMLTQPDMLATFNKPTETEEELRSGNPCG